MNILNYMSGRGFLYHLANLAKSNFCRTLALQTKKLKHGQLKFRTLLHLLTAPKTEQFYAMHCYIFLVRPASKPADTSKESSLLLMFSTVQAFIGKV
jgi:hypothetical protein